MKYPKGHLGNHKTFGSKEFHRHVRLFDGGTHPTKNGHEKVTNPAGNTIGAVPSNRKQFATGTDKSIIRMLKDAGMWLLVAGLFVGAPLAGGAAAAGGMEPLTRLLTGLLFP